MDNNIINESINNLDKDFETKTKKEFNRNLSFFDLFFAGYGFIVGAGLLNYRFKLFKIKFTLS